MNGQLELNTIKDILERNSYRVTAYATDNGCVVIYPKRVDPPICNVCRIQYEYINNGLRMMGFLEDGTLFFDVSIPCKNHTQRLFLFTHIIANCININYPISLIKFVAKGQEDVPENTFLECCTSRYINEQDKKTEQTIYSIIASHLFSKTGITKQHKKLAEEKGVLEDILALEEFKNKI